MKFATKLLPLVLAVLLCLSACGKPEGQQPTYDHSYRADDYFGGGLEFSELSHKDGDPEIRLREIYIDPDTLAHGYVVIDCLSGQELTFTLQVTAQHDDGSVTAGCVMDFHLLPGETQSQELDFSAWADGNYSLVLTTTGLAEEQSMHIQLN